MSPTPTVRSPSRRESLVRLASVLCALLVLAATVSHSLQLRRALELDAEGQLQTVSRIFAKEVDRTLTQTRRQIAEVDARLLEGAPPAGPEVATLLDALPRQQYLLREIAIVDRDGRVIASSDRRSVGVDVSRLDFHADRDRPVPVHVGRPKAGRGLAAVGPAHGEGPEHAADGFLTVSMPVGAVDSGLLGVAVIGADSLVNDLRYLASGEGHQIALYRYDGAPLATAEARALRRTTAHPIFAAFLPDREGGGFVDRPGDGRRWLVHFHTTPDFPVIVEARLPQAAVVARWEDELIAPLAILVVTGLALALHWRTTASALRHRARSEARAAIQERRLRDIVDTAADGILTIDARGAIRDYNRAAETIFGVPASEATGRPALELLSPAKARALREPLERALRGDGDEAFDRSPTIRTVRRDGRPIELQLSIGEVVDRRERLLTVIVRDVTEMRQAEQRFRTLFQRSGEPHLLFDAGGLVDCNDAAARLLHAPSRDALLGRRLEDLAPPMQGDAPSAAVIEGAIGRARAAGVHRLVWNARALDGTGFPVEMTLTPIRFGTQEAMLVAWHDIAERQRYEQQLRAARDAAESAAHAKATFLAMMSHELRTPMTGILGMIDLLGDSALDDGQRRVVGMLRGSAESLRTVLNDVLDFSKVEAGRLVLERIAFEPAAIARDAVALVAHPASLRGVALRTEWDDAAIPALHGDPTRFRQVLSNLLDNAVKFTERGTVTVSMRSRPRRDGRHALTVEVRDTGIGLAPEVLPTLFRPFQQADSSTTRRFGGTGLGLAICRHIVEAMDGEIGVESRPGEGSTFRFTVRLEPAGAPPRPAADDAAPAPPTVRGLRLLVAEDNPTNRMLIGTRLRRASHHVDLVENGVQAVEAVQRTDYDLVLMDMRMPELDGVGATRRIRALPGPRARVPIVALTADALPEVRERHMASGLDDYLTKPIDWRALDRVLRRCVPTPLPAAGARPAPVVAGDRAALEATRAELGDEAWTAVVGLYWPQAELDLRSCRAAVADGDAAARRAAAHALKGASAGIGLDSVARRAASLERCAEADAPAALRALEDALAAARAAPGPAAPAADGRPAEAV
ncbi:MAG TPA: ATP-binding protein [Burkholderiaceae bacterium]|nr:ATP-binding protein [Burkholderiaceae bacterium]